MKIPKKCVVCGSNEVSDTSMNITLYTIKHEVFVCSEHEDTPPSKAKESLKTMLDGLDKLSEKAAEFGYELVEKQELDALKKGKPVVTRSTSQSKKDENAKVVKGTGAKVTPNIVGGDGADQASYAAVDLDNNPNETISELANSEKKISAPSDNTRIIQDATGETIITIANTSDKNLQDIAKMEEQASQQGKSLKRRDCNLCRGSGQAPNNKANPCPKCSGTGQIVYF